MSATATLIRSAVELEPSSALSDDVLRHLDTDFHDLDELLGRASISGSGGPSKRVKKRRTLDDEIAHWEKQERQAAREASLQLELSLREGMPVANNDDDQLAETSVQLPTLLEQTQTQLQTFLSSAQSLSIQRYDLADRLTALVNDLHTDAPALANKSGRTVLQQLEGLQDELGRLDASLAWVSVLERAVLLSEETLKPERHRPSPLAALPQYRELHALVSDMRSKLPADMTLLSVLDDVRQRTWSALKDVLSQNLLSACEAIKWPLKVDYPSLPATSRRAFERAYQDLLYLQAEGEKLHGPATAGRAEGWSAGDGLYPLQAMVQPIALRFKYHFQGSRNTNRVDKPEWAFTNILDQIYDHQAFISEYLQPLTARAGYNFDVRSEFTLLLFPILLAFLRARIPHLLAHPALLAHTIYQTILFDESVKANGFDLGGVSLYEGREEGAGEWEGLAGLVLKQEGWYDQWVAGERKFAEGQMNDIISSADAWTISEDMPDEEVSATGLIPTVSARQVKALIEQLTDRYTPLPSLEHKYPFLTSIQLPLLITYHSRISGSLDAFETLSSAFVRAVPGALSGNSRGGIHVDQNRLTGGVEGLGRLVKAALSAGWILQAMREWADDTFFIELSDELSTTPSMRWRIQAEPLLHNLSTTSDSDSVWDLVVDNYTTLIERAEEMMVRSISVEVENDLKKHLQRRWDQTAPSSEDESNDTSLVNALTTLSSDLAHLANTLPPLQLIKVYRRIVTHLSNHIAQRAVYSGWSKFTALGGKAFQHEVADFLQSSIDSLLPAGIPEPVIEAPWDQLVSIGKVLSLPNDTTTSSDAAGTTFAQAMAAAWSDGDSLDLFYQRLGIEMDRAQLHAVLRRRIECWR